MPFSLAPRDLQTEIATKLWPLLAAGLVVAGVLSSTWPLLAAGLLVAALGLVVYLFSPTGYRVTSEHIQVLRPIGPLTISRSEVRAASLLHLSPFLVGSLLACSGLYAYMGWYWHPKAGGIFRAYATTFSPAVLLEGKQRYLLSPADYDYFIREVNRA